MAAVSTIKRVLVWSGRLRLAHWLTALSTLVLLGTGWLLGVVPRAYGVLLDYHYLAGYVLIAGVLLRLYLLFFGQATETVGALIPRRQQLGAMLDMLRFYISFGRWRLPAWYAHNPLWQPLYLLLLIVLVAQILTGVFADVSFIVAGRGLPGWHALGSDVIAVACGLHIAAVFSHDLKGSGSDISAMVNGHRIFVINPLQAPPQDGVQSVSVDRIGRPPRAGER